MTEAIDDWAAKEAKKHLHYLDKCRSDAEQKKYLAAAIRLAISHGKMLAGEEFAAALGVKLDRVHV